MDAGRRGASLPWVPAAIEKHGFVEPELLFTDGIVGRGAFGSLCDSNAAYVEGKLVRTPYRSVPIGEATLAIVPALLQLHARGFVSTYSKLAMKGTLGSLRKQRSVLCGFLPRAHYVGFYTFLCTPPRCHTVRFLIYQNGRLTHTNFEWNRNGGGRVVMPITVAEDGHVTSIVPEPRFDEAIGFAALPEYSHVYEMLSLHAMFITLVGVDFGVGAMTDVLLDYFNAHVPAAPTSPLDLRCPE